MDKIEEPIKTIRMPKESWDKWEAALLSGEYKQGRRFLYDKETGGYCCLGVLQHCLTGEVETNDIGGSFALPSEEWLREQGISFSDSEGIESPVPYVYLESVYDDTFQPVSAFNDDGFPFSEIVKAMRPYVVTY